ncbi:MAG: C40 family peptidase [Microthrixaceae bacterium]|jgi:cell wall-associated NlpC family hydrolase
MAETHTPRRFALRTLCLAALPVVAVSIPVQQRLASGSAPTQIAAAPAAVAAPALQPIAARNPVPPSTTTTTTLPPPPPPEPAGNVAMRWAMLTLGTPYRYGGTTPAGFDCSGLMLWSWNLAGVKLPRTAAEQRSATRSIARGELQIGDLVFYRGTGHVGMYIGNDQVVHSPRSGKSVEVIPLDRGGMAASSFGRVATK